MFERKPDSPNDQPTFISSISDIRKRREQESEKITSEKPAEKQKTEGKSITVGTVSETPVNKFLTKISLSFSKHKKFLISLSALIIFVLIVFIFKLDGYLFPANIAGIVTDNNSKAISFAKICCGATCTVTDIDGKFSFDDLIYGLYELTVEAKNFTQEQENFYINRSENLNFNFYLKPLATGDLVIPLTTSDQTPVNTLDMKIFIDNDEVPVVLDASNRFYIKDLSLNNYKLKIQTPYFVDIEENVTIKQGLNDFSQIVLKPAIDFEVKAVDWLNKSPVSKPVVTINDKKTVANAIGILKVQDMQYVQNINVKVVHNNYLTKELSFSGVRPGILQVPAFEMVPVVKALFQSGKAGRQNVYSIYLDGSDELMLSGNNGDNFGISYSRTFQNVNFFSTRDNIRNAYGSLVPIPYTSQLTSANSVKIAKTDYSDNGGIGVYNFIAQKRAYIQSTAFDKSDLYFGPIDGSSTELLISKTGGVFKSIRIPDNGRFVTYSWHDKYLTDNNAGIFIYDLSTRKERELFKTFKTTATLFDISSDQKYLLASVTDPLTNQQDLYTININETQQARATNSPEIKTYAQFSGNNLYIYYISSENGMNDVFRVRRDGSSREKITSAGNVTSFILGKNDVVLYVNNATLFAVDPKYPELVRQIAQPVSNFHTDIDVH